MRSPDWCAAGVLSCKPPVLLLTSVPGMDVIDAHAYHGCHHLVPLIAHQQLAVAGIDGATFLGDPEILDLPWGLANMLEVDDHRRHPRYLTRKGNLCIRRCPYPWLPTVPVTPLYNGGVSRSRQFAPCADVHSDDDASLVAKDDRRDTQDLHKRMRHSSYPGRSEGVPPLFSTCLHSIPTSTNNAFGIGTTLQTKGVSVLVSRRVVPTGRLAIPEEARRAFSRQVLPRTCWMPSTGGT